MKRVIGLLAVIALTCACEPYIPTYRFANSDVNLKFANTSNSLQLRFQRGTKVLQRVTLDAAFANAEVQLTGSGAALSGFNQNIEISTIQNTSNFTLVRITRNLVRSQVSQDCFNLDIGHKHWVGGPENRLQYWPVEKAKFQNYSYLTKEEDNCAISERYWLNSEGVFVFIDEQTPLFINQNSPGHDNELCFIVQKIAPYDITENTFSFNYVIGIASDARQAHLKAVQDYLKKPTGYPDERMVRHPIWSTWARYKTLINETSILEFADEILEYKFNNSQYEIDDLWETCYGSLTFNETTFPNIKGLTDTLKAKGFRVTLWIHPFINKDCAETYAEAQSKGFLVVNVTGSSDTHWWNSDKYQAAYIDFTKTEAANWFSARLKKLQIEAGIDSFKYDAGETSWTPMHPVQNGSKRLNPNHITKQYVRTVAKFGDMVEVRSGQGTQDLPIFVRMIDKDSGWSMNNGLPTLVTTLLQMNMAGYPFVLPDMIGGNGYNNHPPDKELFIRWLQANVFMPSLQFSYVPWDHDDETIAISLKFTKLHANYTEKIMERFKLAVRNGDPVNPPLWWVDPRDMVAHQIYDEFLLGDSIISAPVLNPDQRERDIYLPRGKWCDGNNNSVHQGPKWLMSYPAPLDVLPYFVAC